MYSTLDNPKTIVLILNAQLWADISSHKHYMSRIIIMPTKGTIKIGETPKPWTVKTHSMEIGRQTPFLIWVVQCYIETIQNICFNVRINKYIHVFFILEICSPAQ